MDRPALQKLLIDVEARRIDVIVYKVDRLRGRQAALDPTGSRNPGVLADGI
jgi:DNA invertase Pin-like site-specific DNA recombinase